MVAICANASLFYRDQRESAAGMAVCDVSVREKSLHSVTLLEPALDYPARTNFSPASKMSSTSFGSAAST